MIHNEEFLRCMTILSPHNISHKFLLLQEVAQFQNRLNRNMQECQEKARDMMVPGMENDSRKMQKVEDVLINCMSHQVDEHIKLLNPMKERINAALKNYK